MKLLGFASIPAVQQYLRYANSQNLDTSAAIKQAGIDTSVLNNANGRIPGEQFQALIKALISQADDPLMGLHTGRYVQPGSYSVLGYITMSCNTLGDAIERISPYERLVGDMGITEIVQQRHSCHLTWHCAYPDASVRPHMIDNVFASWINFARWLADQDAAPEQILLERTAPGSLSAIDDYQAFFKCPVQFSQQQNTIVLAKSLLHTPLRQPDQLLLKTLETHALQQITELEEDLGSFSLQVAQAIRKQLMLGQARKELIADAFGISPRSLQRKLLAEGTQYQTMMDDIRQEIAKEMLIQTKIGMQDIAYNLGFSDGRSFHRRFKQWTGQTPGEFRQQQHNPQAGK